MLDFVLAHFGVSSPALRGLPACLRCYPWPAATPPHNAPAATQPMGGPVPGLLLVSRLLRCCSLLLARPSSSLFPAVPAVPGAGGPAARHCPPPAPGAPSPRRAAPPGAPHRQAAHYRARPAPPALAGPLPFPSGPPRLLPLPVTHLFCWCAHVLSAPSAWVASPLFGQ
jgi:hypothetical protein